MPRMILPLLRLRLMPIAVSIVVAATMFAGEHVRNARGGQPQVTFVSLLEEMIDRSAVARWPSPAYATSQVSSYDRRQETPDDPAGWFANQDYGRAIRIEERDGRKEWVILEHDGPGCITRMWTPNADSGTVRFYLDGNERPVIECNLQELLAGRALVAPPLALLAVRGCNLYLPIPFARACKITLSKEPFSYAVQYRVYDPEIEVESFSDDVFAGAAQTIARVAHQLESPASEQEGQMSSLSELIPAGKSASLTLPSGAAAVTALKIRLRESDTIESEQTLRSVVLQITFDDQTTVWCPLGEFFGVGISRQPVAEMYRSFAADGMMTCRWTMPYQRSARIELINFSPHDIDAEISATVGRWQWDERSMHFHANWRQQFPLASEHVDWNYIEAEGAGVYVGDTLTTMNPHWSWWGEGDEKIYVDGSSLPVHLGTGLEDYYGYAWGVPNYFQSPFLSASRVRYSPEEIHHIGHTTVSRLRMLDAIPFTRSLRLDMEVSCIGKIDRMAWAVATFWYGRPGTSARPQPMPEEAARPLQFPPGLTRRHLKEPLTPAEIDHLIPGRQRLAGALECEDMMQTTSPGVTAQRQDAYMYNPEQKFSGGDHLHVTATKVGDYVELRLPIEKSGLHELTLYASTGPDSGAIRLLVNGQPLEGSHNLAHEKGGSSSPIELGQHKAVDGMIVLRAVVDEASGSPQEGRTSFGLDCVIVEPPD